MANRNTPLRLADSPNQWSELDETVRECVRAVCARYDDREQTRSFLTLLDLMTNRRYAQGDRESVAFVAEREAFQYTEEFDAAQHAYMDKLIIPTQERKTA